METPNDLLDEPIFSVGELNQKVVVLTNDKNGAFITAHSTRQRYPLVVEGTTAGKFSCFQFVPQVSGFHKLYCLAWKSFCSGVDKGWMMMPTVEDEQWSHFSVTMDATGAITLKSLTQDQNAMQSPYVALPSNWNNPRDPDVRWRICEKNAVPERGTVHAYAFSTLKNSDAADAAWIEEHRFKD